ncbi:unnamed protein product [Adineta ricciae]|uniref:G-protein coupled receptors family 1 profile domain-containing protein n=1 Tax=Adineta ricciae TaxID=249248 RepID=A0A815FM80_ADIRI|nr:unnamed protein product [Adineta ricciae]
MSNSTSTLPVRLTTLQEQLTYIILPFYIVLGIFGNGFCITYFLQRSQRSSSCAFYLLLAAIVNMLAVVFGVTTNIVNLWKSIATTSLIYCKLRMYINHTLIFIGRSFTILASIDIYSMTSQKITHRVFSQHSYAIKYAIGVVICCPLIAVHIPIMNTIVAGQCVMTGVYSLIFAIYQMLIAGIIPPIAMITFSCLAYFNMQKINIRQDNLIKQQQQRQHLRMVITQIAVYIISAELVPITTLYKQLTANVTGKSQDQKAIETFIVFIASNFLLYLNTWAAFFIYYATSSTFRLAFIRIFKKSFRVDALPMAQILNNTLPTNRNA